MKQILSISFIFLLFTACERKQEHLDVLEKTDSLSVFLYLPTSMKIFGDNLFIIDSFDGENMLKVVDLETGKLKYRFAKKGDGPYEFIHINNMDAL